MKEKRWKVKCKKCGHEFDTKSFVPTCSKCGCQNKVDYIKE